MTGSPPPEEELGGDPPCWAAQFDDAGDEGAAGGPEADAAAVGDDVDERTWPVA